MNLSDLYQELIIDHGTCPRNHTKPDSYNHHAEGHNPLCGDQVKVYLTLADDKIQAINFTGEGCAIATASASIMTELLVGKTISEAQKYFTNFHDLLTTDNEVAPEDLGKLQALAGVKQFPTRVKCATLAWHTLQAAIKAEDELVTTE